MSKEDVISLALTVIPDFLYDMTDGRVMDLPLESCLNPEPEGGALHSSLALPGYSVFL